MTTPACKETTSKTPGVGKRGVAALRAGPPDSTPPAPSTRAHSAGRPELKTAGRGRGGVECNGLRPFGVWVTGVGSLLSLVLREKGPTRVRCTTPTI